ncbi:hypothetical protein I352_06051 [Cryptococcus deuterogattii MMRL2647]|nr:hypothetical protein I352_06051 [Cryptococcus deuterogattii MMRL2647]
MSSKENIRPLQNHMPTRNSSKSSIPRTARPDTVPLGIKGMALADDSANSNPPAKVQMVKVTKKDELMEKRIKGLEKRVDCNAHVNRDKISSLDDRLTKLEAHYYSKFSQTFDTLETPKKAESPSALIKSPPVPALKRRMDEAMEWEKSMMSGEITLTGIEEAEEGGEDEETQQNGVQGLQVSFLMASMTQSQQTIASLQFDLDVERGRIADLEARLEDVEDSNDVRDASLILQNTYTYLATPPLTPTTPTTSLLPSGGLSTGISHVKSSSMDPLPSYAALRAHHAYALRYIIAKLRWEQANNLYLPGQDAVWNHDQMIIELEKELHNVEEAKKSLNKFPNCFAPVWFPKPHGPRTPEEDEEIKKLEAEKDKIIDEKLNQHFPFLKQLFIGPKTKQQARNDLLLREQLREGDFEDLSVLLPSANMKMLLAEQQKKAGAPKKNYEQQRMEKEQAKIAVYLEAHPQSPRKINMSNPASVPMASVSSKFFGPLTKEQHVASRVKTSLQIKDQTLYEAQRRQRQIILGWLHKPWDKYDKEAAVLMETMAELAKERLDVKKKGTDQVEPKKNEKVIAVQ